MENITINDYDLDYEYQYLLFMIKILEPLFTFEKGTRGDGWKPKIQKNDGEIISVKDFIQLMHIDFPEIVNEKKKNLYEKERKEKENKKMFDMWRESTRHRQYNRSITEEYISMTDDMRKQLLEYYGYSEKWPFDQLVSPSNYEKTIKNIWKQIETLNQIETICKERNGQIKDIIHLLDLIQNYYLE